jgi:hypothetical protein
MMTRRAVTSNAVSSRRRLKAAVRCVDKFLVKASKDQEFSSELVELVKAGNKKAVATFIKGALGNRTAKVTIGKMSGSNWCLEIVIEILGWEFGGAWGDDC